MTINYFEHDLTSLHNQLVNKEVSAVDLTRASLDNISKTDDKLNAFISTNPDEAIAQAQKIDEKSDFSNVLTGLPL